MWRLTKVTSASEKINVKPYWCLAWYSAFFRKKIETVRAINPTMQDSNTLVPFLAVIKGVLWFFSAFLPPAEEIHCGICKSFWFQVENVNTWQPHLYKDLGLMQGQLQTASKLLKMSSYTPPTVCQLTLKTIFTCISCIIKSSTGKLNS